MRKKRQKGRCSKMKLNKAQEICKCYDKIQDAFAHKLADDDNVNEFSMNVYLNFEKADLPGESIPPEPYTTDFLIRWNDGSLAVRECVFRRMLSYPSAAKNLQTSKEYWEQKGVSDWGIVIEKKQG